MARAISSLPVPVSPKSSTVESVPATISTCRRTARRAELCPTIPSNPDIELVSSSAQISSVKRLLLGTTRANGKSPSQFSTGKTSLKFMADLQNPQIRRTSLFVGKIREFFPAVLQEPTSALSESCSERRTRLLLPRQPPWSRLSEP